jgi:tetratricopeptide (TPR) repeat protein
MSDFSKKINQTFADAYHAAALKEADIQALADALEPVRSDLKLNGDTLATRKALDTAVGGNRDPRATDSLVHLREQFVAWQKEFWVNELEAALEKSPGEAWQFFLHRYVECLAVWRTQLAHWWAATVLGETGENKKIWFAERKKELLRFRANAHLMEQRRWPEAYSFVRELGENALLSPKLRAQCWTTCASIQIYFNTIPDARHDLAEAEKLFPELHFLQLTRADLERIVGNYEASRQILQKLLEKNPADTEALNGMARTFSEEKNFAEAERLLDTAISTDPGNSTNYRDKIGLWAKDEAIFSKNGKKIPELVAHANLADPESQVSNLLEAGYAYQAANNLDEAKKWFEKAQKIEPERPEIFVALGYLHPSLEEHEQAAACFEKAYELSPATL